DTHNGSPSFLKKQDAPAVINRSTGVIAAADRPVKGHDSRYRAVYLFCGFFLIRLDIARRVCADEDVVHHPPQNRMATVGDALFQRQLHQLFGGRGHILKALTEGDYRKAHALQVLHHLHGSPTVKGDLPDIELLTESFDEF